MAKGLPRTWRYFAFYYPVATTDLFLQEAETLFRRAIKLGFTPAYMPLARLLEAKGAAQSLVEEAYRNAVTQVAIQEKTSPLPQDMYELSCNLLKWQEEEDDLLEEEEVLHLLQQLGVDVAVREFSLHSRTRRNEIGGILREERPLTTREDEAYGHLSKLAKQGQAEAGLLCGNFLLSKRLHKEALDVFKSTANSLTDAQAHFLAGWIMLHEGPLADLARARKHLYAACMKGHRDACNLFNSLQKTPCLFPCMSKFQTREETRIEEEEHLHETIKMADGKLDEDTIRAFQKMQRSFISGNASGDSHPCNEGKSSGTFSSSGTLTDHMVTLMHYTTEQPESYSAQTMLQGLLHYFKFQSAWLNDDVDAALENLFLAYVFNETAVAPENAKCNEMISEALGIVELACNKGTGLELETEPKFLKTLFLICSGQDTNFVQSIRIMSEVVHENECNRLLPFYLCHLGSLLMFQGNHNEQQGCYLKAATHFRRALKLLQENASMSLWPIDIDVDQRTVQKLRNTMVQSVAFDLGRALLET